MKIKTDVLNIATNKRVPAKVFKIGTHVRLVDLNYYSTYTKLIEFFNLTSFCDEVSESLKELGIRFRLERIHKKWQVTEYTIEGYAFTSDNSIDNNERILIYYIKSIDGKSHLLVDGDTVEEIKEYHSPWAIE